MKLTKKASIRLSDHNPIIYLLSTTLASCNLKNGFKRFVPNVTRNNDLFLRHKKRMLIVIHCSVANWYIYIWYILKVLGI